MTQQSKPSFALAKASANRTLDKEPNNSLVNDKCDLKQLKIHRLKIGHIVL